MVKTVICLIDPSTLANTNVPNIGLAYISGSLQAIGVDHVVVDMLSAPFPKDRFLKYDAEIFGISVKFTTFIEAQRITELLHKEKPNAKIYWGGAHAHACPYDYVTVVTGDYEYFGMKERPKDLSELPFPSYTKFDTHDYLAESFRSGVIPYPLSSSRGCPYRCTFCNSSKIFKARSAQNCFEEMKMVKDTYKITEFQILDDNFIMLQPRALEFCEKIKQLGLVWACHNGIRANQFDEKMAQAMQAAGCRAVSFGVESTDPEVLKIVNKGETLEVIEKAIETGKKYFSVNGFFIIGLPGSTFEKDMASLDWAKRMGIRYHFNVLVALPGTKLFEDYHHYVDQNTLYHSFFFNDESDMVVSFETPDYPKAKRIEMYNIAMGHRRVK